MNESGRFAVIAGSSCLNDPAAALRGFAKTFSLFCKALAFKKVKSFFEI